MIGKERIIGIVWYRLEDYEAAVSLMEDRNQLPASYSLWRIAAERGEKQLQRAGHITTRAYINATDFAAWCKARGLNVNAESRNLFANQVAMDAAINLE